ncbi:UNVERIFIED_CONTAM: hypothetical protein K2H54_042354 [Gekko kuhli]
MISGMLTSVVMFYSYIPEMQSECFTVEERDAIQNVVLSSSQSCRGHAPWQLPRLPVWCCSAASSRFLHTHTNTHTERESYADKETWWVTVPCSCVLDIQRH